MRNAVGCSDKGGTGDSGLGVAGAGAGVSSSSSWGWLWDAPILSESALAGEAAIACLAGRGALQKSVSAGSRYFWTAHDAWLPCAEPMRGV